MISIDEQIMALPVMPPAQLRALWRDVWRRPAPEIGYDLLRRGIAWKLQARVHGDLPRHVKREIDGVLARLRRGGAVSPARPLLLPGTRLVREWQGKTYQVVVLERGYEFDGRPYRNLTQIARTITGAHQSGLRFFGIKARKPPARRVAR